MVYPPLAFAFVGISQTSYTQRDERKQLQPRQHQHVFSRLLWREKAIGSIGWT